jgi:hypothetical protein
VIGPDDSQPPFEQAYYPGGPLTIGFESARVTYTDFEVDLYNSGVNQILSVAAVRATIGCCTSRWRTCTRATAST